MTLLSGEVILDSLTESVLLTNYRIMKEHGNSYKISIFLEKISSIVMHYKIKPLLLFFGIICFIVGGVLFDYNEALGILSLIVGIILIIAFYLTCKHVLVISPDGGMKLEIEVKRTSRERIEEFLTIIQEAKQAKIK